MVNSGKNVNCQFNLESFIQKELESKMSLNVDLGFLSFLSGIKSN